MDKRGHVLNAVLLSIGLGYVLDPSGDVTTFATIAEVFLPVVLGALFPDVDTAFGKHRKTLHNIPVLVIFLAHPIYHGGNLQWVWLGVLTHYALDYLGSKRGIALFYPVWDREFGFPSGVTTSSDHAEIVTVVITVVELGIVAVLVHVLPQYLPTGLSQYIVEGTASIA
ncbi:metal-dependent hydrolase [Haloarcula litorea]|uniref:metal-dependent hydrolase n=1 Tax=Haloarcula litorea TaxID=3032579 RepID=UPI0023E8C400|nr:metal-dependent hydrolase [Halomicroarcula sp. GDY20]